MSDITTSPLKSTWLSVLFVIVLFDTGLVIIVVGTYNYSLRTALEASVGLIILLAVASFLWFCRRRAGQQGLLPVTNQALGIGIGLGLFWVIEIGINNFAAPPFPARDIVDDSFWGIIAFAILILAVWRTYQANNLLQGIGVGLWSGLSSGILACNMALSLIVFGMGFITHDPLNIQEWAARGSNSAAPTMAAYFAYETLTGAFGHLVVLGIAMGGLLGVVGSIIGKSLRMIGDGVSRS